MSSISLVLMSLLLLPVALLLLDNMSVKPTPLDKML